MRIRVENLSVVYNEGEPDETLGLPSVTFTLESGKPLVLTGANGCGKTTLLKVLAGVVAPSRGSVGLVTNGGIAPLRPNWLRLNVGYLRQDPGAGLFADLTLAENFALFAPHTGVFDPYGRSHRFREQEGTLTRLVSFYSSHRGHRLGELSGGQKQLFATACLGATERQLLLLDEPTSSLDQASTERTEALLRSLCSRKDSIALIVTHDGGLASRLGFDARAFQELARTP